MGAGAEQRRVCVVGSINMDLVVRAPRFPGAGETILGGEFATFPGGKGANQAVAAARMGARVSMIGRVGDDAYGDEMRRVLKAEGIDVSAVRTTERCPTGVAVITVAEGGGNTIVVAPGANARLAAVDVELEREKIEAADALLLQLEVPMDAVTRAAEIARFAGKIVMLNAAPAMELPAELARAVDVVIVNETEAAIIASAKAPAVLRRIVRPPHEGTNGSPAPVAADARVVRLLESLAGFDAAVILTLGEAGAVWISDRTARVTPAYEAAPIDTVGAGDAFCGAIATFWHRASALDPEETAWATRLQASRQSGAPDDPEAVEKLRDHLIALEHAGKSMRIACAAGALATQRRGAIPSLPRYAEVEEFINARTREKHGET